MRVSARSVEPAGMDPRRLPGILQVGVDHITDEDAVRLDGALVPEQRVLLGAPALGVLPVIPVEVGGRRAGMCVVLPGREEQVQVRLLPRAVQGWRIMKGIGDRAAASRQWRPPGPASVPGFAGARVPAAA